MKRFALVLCLFWPAYAVAHVGSPDVFFESDAGPYKLFVTVRTPQVIPGVATIEIRSESPDVRDITVVPMRLTGDGSQLPPTPDHAVRSSVDPQFFTADLWLMERGSLQVRVTVDGARGSGELAVPVPAFAQKTLAMTRGLGSLLFAFMIVLVLAIVGIITAAVREAALEAGELPPARARHRARVAMGVTGAIVVALVALGNLWWSAEAATYDELVYKPWKLEPRVEGCKLRLGPLDADLLLDHMHLMHLFLVRGPDLDRIAHLHPERDSGGFVQDLPTLPAGHYLLFADVVLYDGFPITGTGAIDLPDLSCPSLVGDDAMWMGAPPSSETYDLGGGARMIWDRPVELHTHVAMPLRFHVVTADGKPAKLLPYMGMAGHAMVMRRDASVFAHLHPAGSVAMPALELAAEGLSERTHTAMPEMSDMPGMAPPSPAAELAFPFGFPQPGDYRIFVQVNRAGVILTGVFDAHVVE